jgi:hypothetical protein
MLMFMKEKTYRFHGSLELFLSELMTEWERLRAVYGSDHFTLDFGPPSSDPLSKYTRERQLIYWGDQRREGMAVKIVNFFNLPSLDGENMKLRANIYDEAGNVGGHPALLRWQETESRWLSKGWMEEIKAVAPKKLPQPKPEKPKKSRRLISIRGLLEKIAHRDCYIKKNKKSPPWSYRWDGSIDYKTANSIDGDLKGQLRSQWDTVAISGDLLVELLFQTYPEWRYIQTAEWERAKEKEYNGC